MFLQAVQEDIAEKEKQEFLKSWEGPRIPERALMVQEEEGFPGRERGEEEDAGSG